MINPKFEKQFPRLERALQNTELNFELLPNNPTIKRFIEIAFNYANNNKGRKEYLDKYGSTIKDLTACSNFVYRVLIEAGAILDTCKSERAAQFHYLLTTEDNQQHAHDKGFEWHVIKVERVNIKDLRPGDILIRTKLSARGSGHIAIVIPVKYINEYRLALAHASLATEQNPDGTYKGSPPRLTKISSNFQVIVRPTIIEKE